MIYNFLVYAWSINLINKVDQCIINFIWVGDVNRRKLIIVAWYKGTST